MKPPSKIPTCSRGTGRSAFPSIAAWKRTFRFWSSSVCRSQKSCSTDLSASRLQTEASDESSVLDHYRYSCGRDCGRIAADGCAPGPRYPREGGCRSKEHGNSKKVDAAQDAVGR